MNGYKSIFSKKKICLKGLIKEKQMEPKSKNANTRASEIIWKIRQKIDD